MKLSGGERQAIICGLLLAILFGALASYAEFSEVREDQFHGGVLNEDVQEALFHAMWSASRIFLCVTAASIPVTCLLPVVLWRILRRISGKF